MPRVPTHIEALMREGASADAILEAAAADDELIVHLDDAAPAHAPIAPGALGVRGEASHATSEEDDSEDDDDEVDGGDEGGDDENEEMDDSDID